MELHPAVSKGSSRRTLALRLTVAIGVIAFLAIGPIGQVFGVSLSKAHPQWRMFTGKGRRVCQLGFDHASRKGEVRRLDHAELLGLKRKPRIDKSQLDYYSRSICRIVGKAETGRVPDIRLQARCGSRGQWVDHSQTGSSVCVR